MQKYTWMILLAGMTLISGCTQVATTGAQAVYSRQAIKKNVTDEYISLQAYRELHLDSNEFKDANISVATYNREVLLSGETPTLKQKIKAEEIIKKIPNVEHVYNLIAVASPSSHLQRIHDTWLTTKVKSKLMASDDVDAGKIKVVSENGAVYLMGVVLPEEADAAVEIARSTDGVEKVVKIFSYVSISKRPLNL